MAGFRSGLVDEADLHGFADGQLVGERREAVHRHLAASPGDQARVEAWQGQNDLLRSAFATVENESLPVLLDLSSKGRVQCIPANDAPLVDKASANKLSPKRQGTLVAALATVLMIGIGTGGAWLLGGSSAQDRAVLSPEREQVVETVAASPSADARGAAADVEAGDRLPTTEIPDLHAWGFRLIGADTAGDPPAISFHYRRAKNVVGITVSRVKASSASALLPTTDGFTWHTREAAYAVSGSPPRDLLREIAIGVQKASMPE